ncbi:hypothetical protein B0J15DRAFT_568937, partial [Fusarium solani]
TVVGIAGLTAKFAQCVVKALQAYPDVTIKGFCRSPTKLPQAALDKYSIEIIQGNFDDEGAVHALVRGCDIVICCYYGDNDVMTRGQKILIDACVNEGVPRYVPSDFAKVKGVHILVGALMETFWSPFFHIFDISNETISYWGTGDEKWDLTTYETAAAYAAALLVDKDASGIFRFRGDYKSVLEIKASYEKIYQAPLHLKCLGSLDELYRVIRSQFKEDPDNVAAWGPGCFMYWCTNGIAHLGDNLNNQSYPTIVALDLEGFLRSNKREEIHTADQRLGF